MRYILSIDQGTTSTRAIVFNEHGEIVGSSQQEFQQIYPKAGWVEHDPSDLLGTTLGVIPYALVEAGITADEVEAIGITNQRETTIVWERKTGKAVYNAIVWQCRRTAEDCARLQEQGLAPMIYQKTGLVLDAYFSATKLRWILEHIPDGFARAQRGELCFGTVDTYLMFKLSQGKIFATDYTNASRTMLFNIHTLCWDEELLSLFQIPRCMLPEVYPSSHCYGKTSATLVGKEIPICAVVGDQQSALFGQLCTEAGEMKNTYGTGCFLLMNTGKHAVQSQNGLITTLGASIEKEPPYVLEGSVFIGGAVVQWLRDEMGLISTAEESERLANSVPDSGGVIIVPAFTGLGAPYWNGNARGTICGITRGTNRAHIVRAGLEAIAHQVCDLAEAMACDGNLKISKLAVDGGASKNNFLLQVQADLLPCELERPQLVETTALGSAYLAGLCVGVWQSVEQLKANRKIDRQFRPQMDEQRRQELRKAWAHAVKQTQA